MWTPGEEPLRWDGSANAVEEQLCDRRSLSPERCGRGNGAVAEDYAGSSVRTCARRDGGSGFADLLRAS